MGHIHVTCCCLDTAARHVDGLQPFLFDFSCCVSFVVHITFRYIGMMCGGLSVHRYSFWCYGVASSDRGRFSLGACND